MRMTIKMHYTPYPILGTAMKMHFSPYPEVGIMIKIEFFGTVFYAGHYKLHFYMGPRMKGGHKIENIIDF
jgi:hypothetical protein